MKLKIENFQSLEGITELEFKPGVSMIVGASNSGKTAILRALRGLILNYVKGSKIKNYMTHFKDHLQVDLQLDENGRKYIWHKDSKGKTKYFVEEPDGEVQPYEKCGNDDIFSIDENFPFVLRDKKLLNTHTEKDSLPFPFDLNDVELFKIFEELYNVSSSSIIFKYLKRLETATNSSINTYKDTIARNKKRIEAIVNVEESYDVDELGKIKARAEAVMAGMTGLDDDIATARRNNKISKAIKSVLDSVQEFDLEESSKLIEEIKDLQKDIRIIASNNKIESINVYKKEFETAVIDDYKALSSDYRTLKSLELDEKELEKEQNSLYAEFEEIKSQLKEVDICPLCGSQLKGE